MKNIIIVNQNNFDEKLLKIKIDGVNSLHVVSDYDRTLTKAMFDGKRTKSTFAQLRSGGYLPKEYEDTSWKLYEKYYTIEIDNDIPIKEKSKAMKEWWQKHVELLSKYKLHKDMLYSVAHDTESMVREGVFDFYKLLNKNNIPLLIFSAGQGDVIEEFLRFKKILTKNMHIISNHYEYDKNDTVIGYIGEIIHPFNKNEHSIETSPYAKEIKNKKNVILLGDSLGDINMCDGIEHDNIIKIGFLNFNVQENLEKYKEVYDVIILNDGSMDYVINLLFDIINK